MDSLKTTDLTVELAYVGEQDTLVRPKTYGPKIPVSQYETFEASMDQAKILLEAKPGHFIAAKDLEDYKKTVKVVDKEEAESKKRDRISELEVSIARAEENITKARDFERNEFIANVPTLTKQACIDIAQREHLDVEIEEGTFKTLAEFQDALKDAYLDRFDKETKRMIKQETKDATAELAKLTGKKAPKEEVEVEEEAPPEGTGEAPAVKKPKKKGKK